MSSAAMCRLPDAPCVSSVTDGSGCSPAHWDQRPTNATKGNPMKKKLAAVVVIVASAIALQAPAAMAALQASSRANGF